MKSDPCFPPWAVARDSRMILFSCVETILDCFLLFSFVDECEKVVLSFITVGFFIGKSLDFYNHISQGVVQMSLEVGLIFRKFTQILNCQAFVTSWNDA